MPCIHPAGIARAGVLSILANGRRWADFDLEKEWVRIANPAERRYSVVVSY
jgi:hypothetical protein